MTGLRKFGTKDLGAIVDAAERYSVGLDDVFTDYILMEQGSVKDSYPPYNLVQESNVKWRIEVALAGWSKDEFEVSTESNVLMIRSVTPKNKGEEEYMHRGISSRTFARGFNLSDDVEIGTVTFNNGLLVVELKRIIPEHQKLKVYDIQDTPSAESSSDSV